MLSQNSARPSFLRISCQELFRIFFSAGALLGVIGAQINAQQQ
jgi:hypothetical protein